VSLDFVDLHPMIDAMADKSILINDILSAIGALPAPPSSLLGSCSARTCGRPLRRRPRSSLPIDATIAGPVLIFGPEQQAADGVAIQIACN